MTARRFLYRYYVRACRGGEVSARHSMWWNDRYQRYACRCGTVYDGGEKKAYAQHRAHKAGAPTLRQALEALCTAADGLVTILDGWQNWCNVEKRVEALRSATTAARAALKGGKDAQR